MPKRNPSLRRKSLPLSQRIERAIGMLQMIPKGKQDTSPDDIAIFVTLGQLREIEKVLMGNRVDDETLQFVLQELQKLQLHFFRMKGGGC